MVPVRSAAGLLRLLRHRDGGPRAAQRHPRASGGRLHYGPVSTRSATTTRLLNSTPTPGRSSTSPGTAGFRLSRPPRWRRRSGPSWRLFRRTGPSACRMSCRRRWASCVSAATENAAARQKSLIMRGIAGGLNGLLACLFTGAVIVSVAWHGPRSLAGPGVASSARRYDRLLRWGARLGRPAGRPTRRGSMPRRWAARGTRIVGRVRAVRRGSCAGRRQRWIAMADALVQRHTRRPPTARNRSRSRVIRRQERGRRWTRLWAAMRRVWLARWWRRPKWTSERASRG